MLRSTGRVRIKICNSHNDLLLVKFIAVEDPILIQKLIDFIECPLLVKSRAGVIIFCNKALEELNGLSCRKVIGLSEDQILPQKEVGFHRRMDLQIINTSDMTVSYTITKRNNDGLHRNMNVQKSFVKYAAGSGRIMVALQPILMPDNKGVSTLLTPRELDILYLLAKGYSRKKLH